LQQDIDQQKPTIETAKPAKPRHRQWSGAVVGLLFGMGGLVAGRLGHLYPHFDVFAQFGLQFLVVTLAFICSIFFSNYKALVGIVITVALLALYSAWPHIVSNDLQANNFKIAKGERALRIAHFNTYKNNADYGAIAEEILRLDADIVGLLEVSDMKKLNVLPKLLTKYPYQMDCKKVDSCDISIVSKIPFTETSSQTFWDGPPYAMIKLGGNFSGVSIFSVHTTRFPQSRAQLKQVTALAKLMANVANEKIVMGDFNSTIFSRVLSTLEKGAALQRITDMPTWPALIQMPQLAIDHIFISDGFRVVGNQQIGRNAGSDHFPILATVALRPQK
jgi:endonuclease/exonuclease/phosphatase (EEP) superfamily protein YafD